MWVMLHASGSVIVKELIIKSGMPSAKWRGRQRQGVDAPGQDSRLGSEQTPGTHRHAGSGWGRGSRVTGSQC